VVDLKNFAGVQTGSRKFHICKYILAYEKTSNFLSNRR
jgi:hypothetical protein